MSTSTDFLAAFRALDPTIQRDLLVSLIAEQALYAGAFRLSGSAGVIIGQFWPACDDPHINETARLLIEASRDQQSGGGKEPLNINNLVELLSLNLPLKSAGPGWLG